MTKLDQDKLMNHDYDGIQELDNDLPSWWLKLFYLMIVISVVYMLYYHMLGIGHTSAEEYLIETDPNWARGSTPSSSYSYHSPFYDPAGDLTPMMLKKLGDFIGEDVSFEALVSEAKRRASADQRALLNASFPDESLALADRQENADEPVFDDVDPLTDETSLLSGKEIWIKNCVACHGMNGQGGIGPNLTDNYWINGGRFRDIMKTIVVGVPAKGMISWQATLPPDQIHSVASFVFSLVGTNPANPKAPQGDLYQQ